MNGPIVAGGIVEGPVAAGGLKPPALSRRRSGRDGAGIHLRIFDFKGDFYVRIVFKTCAEITWFRTVRYKVGCRYDTGYFDIVAVDRKSVV